MFFWLLCASLICLCRVINVFNCAIAVPVGWLLMQYASITESNSESPSLVSTMNQRENKRILFRRQFGRAAPRLRNSCALDFFKLRMRFSVRLPDPLSFGWFNGSVELAPDDKLLVGTDVAARFALWAHGRRGRRGEWGRRQPLSHVACLGRELVIVISGITLADYERKENDASRVHKGFDYFRHRLRDLNR